MFETLTRNWWIQLIRGALALALGVTALIAPSTSMMLAVFLVAAFAIGDGAMTITAALGVDDDTNSRGALLAAGAGFIALGLVVLFWPGISVGALVALFAVWLIASGALLGYGAMVLRPHIPTAGIMVAVGAVVAVAGLALLVVGPSTVDAVLPFAGWFGAIIGVAMMAVALRLRRGARTLPEQALAA